MSRRSILAIPARVASARSCHSAAFRMGASCSASARTGSDLNWGDSPEPPWRSCARWTGARRARRPQNFAGQGPLILGKGGNRRLAMDPLGFEAGSLRAGWTRGPLTVLGARPSLGPPVVAPATLTARLAPSGPLGAGVPPVAGPLPGPIGAAGLAAGSVPTTVLRLAISARRVAVASAPRVAVSPPVTLIVAAPPIARGACALPPGVPVGVPVAAGSRNERGGNQRAGAAADQLEPSRRLRTSPGGEQRDYLQSVQPAVHFGLQNRADGCGIRDQGTGNLALGSPRPGGPPGPGAVVTPAGEFYLDSARHGPQSYTPRQRLTTAGNMHYVKLCIM